MTGMLLGTAVTVAGALVKPPDGYWSVLGPLFLLYGAGIAAYNWANLRQSQNGSAPPL